MKRLVAFGLALMFVLAVAGAARADTIYWANWTSVTAGNPGSATGTMALPGGGVTVAYTGETYIMSDTGNWSQYPGTYTLPGVVDNAPSPSALSLQIVGYTSTLVNTLTFSTPVVNPVFAVQSLGSSYNRAVFTFDAPFTILAQGPGHWGGTGSSLSQDGNSLIGSEGNGILQFYGTYSSLSWTIPENEYYGLFTVGAPAAVPEPASLLLLGTGLAGLGGLRRRFRR